MISVITTIAEPTNCVKGLEKSVRDSNGLIIIGDKKGPFKYDLPNTQFYSLDDQLKLDFYLAKLLPTAHYARKNLGYLIAIKQGEKCIYETDDDNQPNSTFKIRSKETEVVFAQNKSWTNVYKHFSSENIWPRGFLLDRIGQEDSLPVHDGDKKIITAPIQQGLADVSPDVDAIWRLTQDREFYFDKNDSIALKHGQWCPFNTQSTWWWEEAFPLLYLPSYCSFRMTDIWKSFIAQRCIWELGHPIVFHAAEVDQDRNVHNLMRDFESEVSGYLQNEKLTKVLEDSKLLSGDGNVLRNLVVCYEDLVKNNILPEKELDLVNAWAKDIDNILK
ncbi:STELLO glycosyltransferase family protein [Winogradskyella sp. HB-48]|uniref:STELLO glycosyltransferase family protein n=1 Tax=Winogradskyella sp. HB-48 TaxID=3416808 RepID=UPI003CEBE52A